MNDLTRAVATAAPGAPVSDVDLFSDEVLYDPYPVYEKLREMGAAVWLDRIGQYIFTRYDDVKNALATPTIFSSAHGAFMNEDLNHATRGFMICSDDPEHLAMRNVLIAPLLPKALLELKDRITVEAEGLVERLVARKRFDAATDLAQYLPLTIVSELVGVPEDGRDRMLLWAAAIFNCIGPTNQRTIESFPITEEMINYALTQCTPDKLKPDGWAARIWAAAERGEIPLESAPWMINDYLAPSLDTTIFATQSAVRLFAEFPEQWDILRENPQLIPNAVNEVIRRESPIQNFARLTLEPFEIDGVTLPAHSRVIMSFGAANRDPRKWENPDMFDVRRQVAGHLGFGYGTHQCAGANLARLEITALLTALVKRVERFELHDAERCLNNTLRGHNRLDVSVH